MKWDLIVPNTALFDPKKARTLFANETKKALNDITSVAKANIVLEAPIGATSQLRNTIGTSVKKFVGKVFTGVDYAVIIEKGRRAKPVGKIADPSLEAWLRNTRKGRRMLLIARTMMMKHRKSNPSTAQVVKSAIFVLKRSMKNKKREPNPFFSKGVKQSRPVILDISNTFLKQLAIGLSK